MPYSLVWISSRNRITFMVYFHQTATNLLWSLHLKLYNPHCLKTVYSKKEKAISCDCIANKKGLKLLRDVLSIQCDDKSDNQIKQRLQKEKLETISQASKQLKNWQIPIDILCQDCRGVDLLIANAAQWRLDEKVNDLDISHDSQIIVVALNSGTCNSYDMTGKLIQQIASRDYDKAPCTSIVMTPDKKTIAMSYCDEDLVWRRSTNETQDIPFGQSFEQSYCSIKTTPNGTLLMSRTDEGIVIYLITETQNIPLYSGSLFWPTIFSHTGEFIYAADNTDRSNLLLLNSKDGSLYATGTGGNSARIMGISCSHDNEYIFTGDKNGGLAIYDFKGILRAKVTNAHTKELWTISSAHGPKYLIATGGFDGTIKLWLFNPSDKNSVKPVQTISGGMHQVCKIKFTKDNFWLFSWDTDEHNKSSTRIWDKMGNNIFTWNNTSMFQLSSDNAFLALVFSPKSAVVYNMKMLKELGLLPTLMRAKLIDALAQLKNTGKTKQLSSLRELAEFIKKSECKIPHLLEIIYRMNLTEIQQK